jgi:Transposase domain (DUF772)
VNAVLADMHGRLKPYYSEIGRPSVDPELMIRMLIVGHRHGLRSEHRLTQEVELHVAYVSSPLMTRSHTHTTRPFRRTGCIGSGKAMSFATSSSASLPLAWPQGLVKGEGFAVDASVMEANASRYHGQAPDEIAWAVPEHQTRAVREYLAGLKAQAEPNPERKPPKVMSPSDPCSEWTAKATTGARSPMLSRRSRCGGRRAIAIKLRG